MALVGGIGGLVNGAISGATSAAGAAGADVGAANSLSDASYPGADWAGAGLDGAASSGMEVASDGFVSGAMNPTDMRLASGAQSSPIGGTPTSNIRTSTQTIDVATPAPAVPTVNDVSGARTPSGALTPAGARDVTAPQTPYDTNPTDLRLAAGTQKSPMGPPTSTSSFMSTMLDFTRNNKDLMRLGAGAIKGMNDSAMFDKRIDLEQQRLNQTSYGSAVADTSVRPTGIIGGARA